MPAAAPAVGAPLAAHSAHFAAALHSAAMAQAAPVSSFVPAALPAGAAPYVGAPSYAAPATYVPPDPHANSELATEMLALMEAVGQGRPVDSWMPTQNLSLVGRMFDDMYTDSRLNEAARPTLGKLQFPVMKVALADPSFFSNPAHPVRSLVNDVFDTLTTQGAASGADLHRLEELIQELLKRFDLDPVRLRKSPQMVAVTEADAEKFLKEQQQRLEEQDKALRAKIRRIVVQELRLHLAGRHVPQPAMKLLLSGLGPMMGIHYRHGGPTSPEWQRALKLLDRVLASFDPAPLAPDERAQLEAELQAEVYSELAALGMPAQKVDALVERLREAHEEFAAELAAAPAPAPSAPPLVVAMPRRILDVEPPAPAAPPAPSVAAGQSALHMLLSPGEWFRVWEAKAKSCRWLKLVNYYESHDCVVFEDFAGDNRLQMKATVFGHDLAAGRSVPVNPSPVTTDLIRQLPAPPAEPADPCASWLSPQPAAQRAA
jgi:hypothetical protein